MFETLLEHTFSAETLHSKCGDVRRPATTAELRKSYVENNLVNFCGNSER